MHGTEDIRLPIRRVAFFLAVLLGLSTVLVRSPPNGATTVRVGPSGADLCATFIRDTCLFDKATDLGALPCRPRDCDFDAASEEIGRCGFPETGHYVTVPATACAIPFMSITREKPLSPCGSRCCSADMGGRFIINGSVPGGATRYVYQPVAPATCSYAEVTRGQLLAALEQARGPLVVFGDSMMRQLYLRLVMAMRGQHRLIDYTIHTHAQYLTCDAADAFRLSPHAYRTSEDNADSSILLDEDYVRETIAPFFHMEHGPGLAAARRSLARCAGHRISELDFVFAPEFDHQTLAIRLYMETLASMDHAKPVVVVSVGFWEGDPIIPETWLNTLGSLRGRVSKVFVVGVATEYSSEEEEKCRRRKNAYFARNAAMKAWCRRQGAPFVYVDFDLMSSVPGPRPPIPLRGDKHFMCRMGYGDDPGAKVVLDRSPEGRNALGMETPQVTTAQLKRLTVTEDGHCADFTNYNLWQMMLNALME
jgi:hypothetical protein